MAQKYYGFNKGEHKTAITTGSSSTAGCDVELRYDIASALTKQEVLDFIELIKQSVIEDSWQPS